MGTLLSIREIVTFAVEREEESYALYKALSENVDDPDVKDLFAALMEEERKHRVYYAELLAGIAEYRTPSVHADDDDAYMRVLIDSQQTVKAAPPATLDNLREILEFAVAREKDAVLFYTGLENYVPEEHRLTVRGIIKEEAGHIVKLSGLQKKFA